MSTAEVDTELLKELHWLPVEQRISYKPAVLTFKIQHMSAPAYLSRHIRARSGTQSLWSSAFPFLDVPFRRTDIGKRSFSCAAPATWSFLPAAVINCDALSLFRSRLKNHLFNTAYSKLTCSTSASEAMALWCSTNVLLLLILLLLLLIVLLLTRTPDPHLPKFMNRDEIITSMKGFTATIKLQVVTNKLLHKQAFCPTISSSSKTFPPIVLLIPQISV